MDHWTLTLSVSSESPGRGKCPAILAILGKRNDMRTTITMIALLLSTSCAMRGDLLAAEMRANEASDRARGAEVSRLQAEQGEREARREYEEHQMQQALLQRLALNDTVVDDHSATLRRNRSEIATLKKAGNHESSRITKLERDNTNIVRELRTAMGARLQLGQRVDGIDVVVQEHDRALVHMEEGSSITADRLENGFVAAGVSN